METWALEFTLPFNKSRRRIPFYLNKSGGNRSGGLAQNNYNPDSESNSESSIFGRRWPTPHKIALAPLI